MFQMVKSDRWILEMAGKGMIEPFDGSRVKKTGISWGLGSYGYDIRVADEFKVFHPSKDTVMDPRNPESAGFDDFKGNVCIIPPNSFVLGRSFEYFRVPRDVLGLCTGKSTYARSGIIINVTPLEPEWEGFLTISIANTAPVPAKIYANEGLAQIIFIGGNEPCEVSYKDRAGKYQSQNGITLSKA